MFFDIHELYGFLNGSRTRSRIIFIAFKKLAPPRMADQESALCELPVEAGHVCGFRSMVLVSYIISEAQLG